MKKAGRVTVMGGAGFGGGNVTAAAEFNIWQDAEAAKIVLEAETDPSLRIEFEAR